MREWANWAAVAAFVVATCGADSCEIPALEDSEGRLSVTANVAGTWTGSDFTLACQPSGTVEFPPSTFTLTLTQGSVTPSGISVSGTLSATDPTVGTAAGTVDGTLSGSTLTFAVDVTITPPGGGTPSCAFSLSGTGVTTGNSMTITLSGNVTSGTCCGGVGGSISGTATATR